MTGLRGLKAWRPTGPKGPAGPGNVLVLPIMIMSRAHINHSPVISTSPMILGSGYLYLVLAQSCRWAQAAFSVEELTLSLIRPTYCTFPYRQVKCTMVLRAHSHPVGSAIYKTNQPVVKSGNTSMVFIQYIGNPVPIGQLRWPIAPLVGL